MFMFSRIIIKAGCKLADPAARLRCEPIATMVGW